MPTFSTPNHIESGDPVEASPVQQNYEAIESFLNNQVVHADGSRALTALPSGPNVNPTSSTQLANKRYVDSRTRLISRMSRPTGSLGAYGSSSRDMDVNWSFMMPTLEADQFLKISMFVPWIDTVSRDGGYVQAGRQMQVRLLVGSDVVCMAQTNVSPSPSATQSSLVGWRLLNPSWTPGSTVNVTTRGYTFDTWTQGAWSLGGDATRPIQYTAEVV